MKKFALLILMTFVILTSFGQKVKRTSAWNYLNDKNYAKAIEYIEPTITHEKTMHEAKTWYYRSLIYINAYVNGDSVLRTQFPDALPKAYESLVKTKELDKKEEFTREVNYNFKVVADRYYLAAADYWNIKDYNAAGEAFEQLYVVSKNINVYDTSAYKNAGLAYFYGENFVKSKEIFGEMVAGGVNAPEVYITLYKIYIGENDTAVAIEYLSKGLDNFPDNYEMIIERINLYLAKGDAEKVIESLMAAIKNDPNNAELYSVAGSSYQNMGENDKALEYYEKALEIDEGNYQANYNMGAYYNNLASEFLEEANDLPLSETAKYDELKGKGDEYLKKAYPYLEKAYEINPADKEPLQALHKIYIILKMNDELKTVNERLKK